MSGPFIFIGTHRIKEGKLAQFKRDAQVLVDFARDHEPRLIAFNFYLNDDETEASVVQVHPDAASMLFHMQAMRETIKLAVDEVLITKDIQIYGPPNDVVRGMIASLSQEGVAVISKPLHFGGVVRSSAEA